MLVFDLQGAIILPAARKSTLFHAFPEANSEPFQFPANVSSFSFQPNSETISIK